MWEESSLSINPHCTMEKGYGLTPTKMLKIWSIPKRDFTPNLYFYSSDCVELEIYSKNMTKCMVRIYQWMQSSPTSYMHNFITFSSNLFHWQITQRAMHQLSDPENKKRSPWKVFGINHPQTLRLLSRIGPRNLDMRLSQHYIGPKMTFRHFPNFCGKKFPGFTK